MAKQNLDLKKVKVSYQDIEREVVKDDEIVADTIDAKTQQQIVRQVNEEYNLSFEYNQSRRQKMLVRLKLYNNQRRDAEAVGDPLLFTVFNTLMASLYDDRLMASWEGRGGEGDEEHEENLNALAEYDYDLMQKSEMDYYWNWDAGFFGRGLVLQMDFDRSKEIMAPVPEYIDAPSFIRDPRASSVNGDMRGRGAMRFGGYPIGLSYYELKDLPGFFNIGSLKKDRDVMRSLIDEVRDAHREAQGNENYPQKEEGLRKFENYEFQLMNWFTTIKGKKYLVTLGNRMTQVVRLISLDKYGGKWPITDRVIYPMSNDWDGVSIPDLIEDKQRARAVLTNLALKSAKSEVLPQYLFDQTRIKNKNDLNFRFNKFIGVDGRVDNAIMALQKSTVHNSINVIMDVLDTAAQRATATPEIQQGVQSEERRTLGEINLVASKVDTRYSMSAKVFGWSERAFWQQWYRQYKVHFKDGIDEKVLRIQGALGPAWRPLTRENIISTVDPDVKIQSKVISEAKRLREQQQFDGFAVIALQDPANDRRSIEKKLAQLRGMRKEEIEMMFPPTVDEMQAEDENELLNEGKMPPINVQDDHRVHIRMHARANQTAEAVAHIRAHKKMMLVKRDRIDLFPPEPQPQFGLASRVQPQGQPEGVAPDPNVPAQ